MKDISEAHIRGIDLPALIERLRQEAILVRDILQEEQDAHFADIMKRAAPVVDSEDPLELVGTAIRAMGYGGDIKPALLVYLSATSRVLAMRPGTMPVHCGLHSSPSGGKTYTLSLILKLLPPEAYVGIDAGSPKVLIYLDVELRHKVLVFGEADSLPAGEDNPAASAIRALLQDHRLHYQVVVRDPAAGDFTVRDIDVPGPTTLLTTYTRRLGDQLDSRLYTIDLTDSQAQIQQALTTQARIELDGSLEPPDALIAFQALLQAKAPWDVVVPYAGHLAEALGRSPAAPRLLRDFARLLSLVKSVTVLRHKRRHRDATGRLIAALDDYRIVRSLVFEVYADSVTGGANQMIRDAVELVKQLRAEGNEHVTVTMIANKLGISKMAASRRVAAAERGGWLVDNDRRKNVKDLDIGEPLPEKYGLPPAKELGYVEENTFAQNEVDACNTVTPFTETHGADDASNGIVHDARMTVAHTGAYDAPKPLYSAVSHVTPLHINGISPTWAEIPADKPQSCGTFRFSEADGKYYIRIDPAQLGEINSSNENIAGINQTSLDEEYPDDIPF